MEKRKYVKRKAGDVVNGAVLVERIDGRLWKMRCKCGNIFIAQPSCCNGLCKKCAYEKSAKERTIHGESPSSGKKASRIYRIWLGMKDRCNNKNDHAYYCYGGRGISVCKEWDESYLSFKNWSMSNGYKGNLSIDRIDCDGNYCPENCRWANNKQQSRNRRNSHMLTYNGETKTISEWSEITGIKYHTLKQRINKYGFTVEEALTIPVKCWKNKKEENNDKN